MRVAPLRETLAENDASAAQRSPLGGEHVFGRKLTSLFAGKTPSRSDSWRHEQVFVRDSCRLRSPSRARRSERGAGAHARRSALLSVVQIDGHHVGPASMEVNVHGAIELWAVGIQKLRCRKRAVRVVDLGALHVRCRDLFATSPSTYPYRCSWIELYMKPIERCPLGTTQSRRR
jgi:hypothetical protein